MPSGPPATTIAALAAAALTAWPVPKALEGVKSKKRAIFKVDAAEAELPAAAEGAEDAPEASVAAVPLAGLSVSLESRVAALRTGGRAAAALVLGEEPASGDAFRQRGLAALRLGPGLAPHGARASTEEHLAAAGEALQREKPQIVVLDECLRGGGVGWARAFARLLRSEALRSFAGGVVVCCEEETFAVRKVCTERWALVGSKVSQEDAGGNQAMQIFEDALGTLARAAAVRKAAEVDDAPSGGRGGKKRGGGGGKQRGGGGGGGGAAVVSPEEEALQALVEQARSLSEFMFEEDLDKTAEEEGWTVTFLVSSSQGGDRTLCGYMCHKQLPAPRAEFYIERVAVSQKVRGKGLGRQLMRWAMEEAVRMPQDECHAMTCSAFDWVVPFYQKFGFEVAPCPEPVERDEEYPQTWMRRSNVSLVSDVSE